MAAKKGVDTSKIEFLEIPFPQMADALFQKRVDAVWNVEPFVTFMMKSGKAHLMAYPYQDNMPGMDISNYFAKESWVRANPDVARRFKRASTAPRSSWRPRPRKSGTSGLRNSPA